MSEDQPIPAGDLPTSVLLAQATALVREFSRRTLHVEDLPRPADIATHTAHLATLLRSAPQAVAQLQAAATEHRRSLPLYTRRTAMTPDQASTALTDSLRKAHGALVDAAMHLHEAHSLADYLGADSITPSHDARHREDL